MAPMVSTIEIACTPEEVFALPACQLPTGSSRALSANSSIMLRSYRSIRETL
jgi:hypothetical protein